jgi:RNA polymerase sigma-70 factor, ECF subfamily
MIHRSKLPSMPEALRDKFEPLAADADRGNVRVESNLPCDDDATVVRAARAGDRVAFGQLYDRYARVVHGILLGRVPITDVDDLVHDVFLRALPRLHTLRQPERFGAWLIAIARNCANDYYRHKPECSEAESELGGAADPGHDGSQSLDTEAAKIFNAIRSLPDAYRETLLLRFVEGMTGPEIASRTGLTHGSVRVNLHRGMQQLRAKLTGMRSNPDNRPSHESTARPAGHRE